MYNSVYYDVNFYDVDDVKRNLNDCILTCEKTFAGACNFFACLDNTQNTRLTCFEHMFDTLFWLSEIYQTPAENIYLTERNSGVKLDYVTLEYGYYEDINDDI